MKILEPAIYELLKDLAGGRVYVLSAQQGTDTSCIVFQKTDSERWRDINSPAGVAQAYIQVDCYAADVYDAKRLAAKAEKLLDGFSGTVVHDAITDEDGTAQTSVNIAGISLQNDVDLIDQTDEPRLFRTTASYLVTYFQ